MKRTIGLLVVMLAAALSASAQCTIKGRVADQEKRGIEYSSIALLNSDSTLVKGTTSDASGHFTIGGLKEASYIIRVSSIGYLTVYRNIDLSQPIVEVGDINLTEASTRLSEVEVRKSNVIQRVDRMLVIPSKIALKNSYNPFDLLFNMGVPHLCINPISKDLSVNGGGVQLRINGIKATTEEVSALLPKDIIRVEMVENPGERYGDGSLGAVLDIIVHHRQTGGVINIQTTNSPHVLFGENSLSAKFNENQAQWGVSYSLGYRGVNKNRTDKNELFYLSGATLNRIQHGIDDRSRWADQNIDLSYNYAAPGKRVFNVVLRNSIYNAPHQDETNQLYNASNPSSYILSKLQSSNKKYSPSLDLYYQQQLAKQQTITVNLTGTTISTESDRDYRESTVNGSQLTSIISNVDGKKHSLIGEAIYDKRFTGLVLSSGIRYYQMHAENKYSGTSPVTSTMNQLRTSAFVEAQGVIKKVGYGVSLGLTRSYFEEGDQKHTYYTFSPIVRLAFTPHKSAYISYRFNTEPQLPLLSSLTNVEQAIDTIQLVRGNPKLKPYNTFNNTFNYSYSYKKVILLFNLNYSYKNSCIMESVFTENDKIVSMEENQKSYHSLEAYPSIILRGLTCFGIEGFLTLSLEGGESGYWSNGNRYSHSYKNFFYNAQFMMRYKEMALMGQFSKNKNVLWGETIYKGENQTALLATWTHKHLQLGAGMMFPFTNNFKTGKERLSKAAPYTSWSYTKEAGQMVVVRINYNFEFGHRHESAEKRTNNTDNDAGIIKLSDK